MRKGCGIITLLITICIAAGGYYAYRYLRGVFEVPHELAAYDDEASMLALITSTAPPPGASEHLTPERVQLFIGAVDPVAAGWRGLLTALDSMHLGADGDSTEINFMTTPTVIHEIIRLPLVTRRGLVEYLNAKNLSLQEYTWLKERTVAASGITLREYDSALHGTLQRYISSKNVANIRNAHDSKLFFDRVEELRSSGAVDSSDMALAAPYRSVLLDKGLPVLLNIENDFADTPEATLESE